MQKIKVDDSTNLYFVEYEGLKALVGLSIYNGRLAIDHIQDVDVILDVGGGNTVTGTFDHPSGHSSLHKALCLYEEERKFDSFETAIKALQEKGFRFL